jgi:hypothetical protein
VTTWAHDFVEFPPGTGEAHCTVCGKDEEDAAPTCPGPREIDRAASPAAAPPFPLIHELPPRVIAMVNGAEVAVEPSPYETLGVLAHRVLAAEGRDWLTVELRDEKGFPLNPREHAGAYVGKRIWISPPIGHGG